MHSAYTPLLYNPICIQNQICDLLEPLVSPFSNFELNRTQHWGKLSDEKTTQSCKRQLTVFFFSLKTFGLANIMVGMALGHFPLMISEGWMNLERQVTRPSMPCASAQPGAIQSKLMNFYTIENAHVQYLRYQKGSTEISTLCTAKVSSPSVS